MQYITSEQIGGVRRITLNRPEVLNAINADMHWELEETFNQFAAAADEHICVVTGAGLRAVENKDFAQLRNLPG